MVRITPSCRFAVGMIDPHMITLFAPIARNATEVAVFAYLDADGRLLGLRHLPSLSAGTIEVPVRAVASDALAFRARQVVMAHNHPSGDAEPSGDDLITTRRLARALDALGVRLVEHLVLAGDRVTSFRERGLL